MRRLKSIITLSLLTIITFGMVATGRCQESPKSAEATSKELKKKDWERQRESKRATKAALKAHMKHQTKDVRKRMKKDAKKAKENNGNGY